MDKYQQLLIRNNIKQQELDDLKKLNMSLNVEEDTLREKILFKYQELEKLKNQFDAILQSYIHIMNSSRLS